MEKLKNRKIYKFLLAFIGVLCALLAGIFALGKDDVKAEESILNNTSLTTTSSFDYDGMSLVLDGVALVYDIDDERKNSTINPPGLLEWGCRFGNEMMNLIFSTPYIDSGYKKGDTVYTDTYMPVGEGFLVSSYTYYTIELKGSSLIDDYNNVNTESGTRLNSYSNLNADVWSKCIAFDTHALQNYALFYSSIKTHNGEVNLSYQYNYYWLDIQKHTVDIVVTKATMYVDRFVIKETGADINTEVSYRSNYIYEGISNLAQKNLAKSNTLSEEEIELYFNYNGLYNFKDLDVNLRVNYERMVDEVLTPSTASIIVKGRYIYDKNYLVDAIYNSPTDALKDKNRLSDFNIIRMSDYRMQDNFEMLSAEWTFREAIDISYDASKDFNASTKTATLNVVYEPYRASDFFVRIESNAEDVFYTLEVRSGKIVDDGLTKTITFDFDKMNGCVRSAFGYVVDFGDFVGDDVSSYWSFSHENTGDKSLQGISYTLTQQSLVITVNKAYEDNLKYFSAGCVFKVKEDILYDVYTTYYHFDSVTDFKLVTSDVYSLPISYVRDLDEFHNVAKSKEFGELVSNGLKNAILDGETIVALKSDAVVLRWNPDGDDSTYDVNLIVQYDSKPILNVMGDNGYQTKSFILGNNLVFNYSEFFSESDLPEGYRVSNIEGKQGKFKIIGSNADDSFNEFDPYNTTIEIASDLTTEFNENGIQTLVLYAHLTDAWRVKYEHLVQYQNSPFAVPETSNIDVKYSKVGHLPLGLTSGDAFNELENELLDALGLKTFGLIKIVNSDKYMTTVNGVTISVGGTGTYVIKASYDYHAMVQIDSNGTMLKEYKIPLTSYAIWQAGVGKDFSIMMLNRGGDVKWFNHPSDVDASNLYGFFDIAIFNTQMTNLNDVFASYTAGGCRTMFNEKEVYGSGIYKWGYQRVDSGWNIIGKPVMWVVEAIDSFDLKQDNGIYYTHFFYLDATNDEPFYSSNGAEDDEDDKPAWEKEKEKEKQGFFEKIGDFFTGSTFGKVVMSALIVLGGVLIVAFIVFIVRKIRENRG